MINNIFRIFDPSSSYKSIRWLILIVPIFINILNLIKKRSKIKKIVTTILILVHKEINQLIEKTSKNISIILIEKIFFIVILINFTAIVPFNFTPTAHISVTLSISITIWTSIILWGWLKSFKKIIIHITPIGTPKQLINFMVVIEIISNIIRPITLSIRLSANIVAGHLLIILLSRFSIINKRNSIIRILFLIILTILEIIVAIIQAYVLTILLTLYHRERIN